MHGFNKTEDDEMERIIKERRIDERGSFANGDVDPLEEAVAMDC